MNFSNKIVSLGLLSSLLIVQFACKTPKTTETNEDPSDQITQERIVGIVRKSNECGFYIEGTSEEKKVLYMPDNLESKFQVEGMKLKFGYKPSTTKLEKKCEDFKPVLISDVDPLR